MANAIGLIDDSKVMRSILRKAILMCNYEVQQFYEAENGEQGYSLLAGNPNELDIAFLDLHMPGVGGLEMLKRLHAGGGSGVPIVIVSTSGDDTMRRSCLELGAVGFIRKPFTPQEIGELMEQVVGPGQAE